MRRRNTNREAADASSEARTADSWITLGEDQDAAVAKAAALNRLTELAVPSHASPGRNSFGIAGIRDDDIRVDLLCGRDAGPSVTRISVRKSALDAVTTHDEDPTTPSPSAEPNLP